MIAESYNSYVSWLENKIRKHSGLPGYSWRLAIFCSLVTWFFAFPDYYHQMVKPWPTFKEHHVAMDDKIDHPFSQVDHNPDKHSSKLIYRLTVPIIAHVFHLHVHQLILIQHFLGILIFYLIFNILYRYTQDNFVSTCVVISLALTYIGNAAYHDLLGFFEGFLFTFVLMAFFVRHPFLRILFVLLALFTDERGIFALGFLFLGEYLLNFNEKPFPKRELKFLFLFVFPIIIYLITRKFIGWYFDIHLVLGNQIGMKAILLNLSTLCISIFASFEGFLFVLAIFFYLLFKKSKRAFWLVGVYSMLFFGAASMVLDTTRSFSYGFGLLLIATVFIRKNLPDVETKNFFAGVLIFNLVAQNQLVVGNLAFWIYPLPIRLLEWLLNG